MESTGQKLAGAIVSASTDLTEQSSCRELWHWTRCTLARLSLTMSSTHVSGATVLSLVQDDQAARAMSTIMATRGPKIWVGVHPMQKNTTPEESPPTVTASVSCVANTAGMAVFATRCSRARVLPDPHTPDISTHIWSKAAVRQSHVSKMVGISLTGMPWAWMPLA
jgi:hypothetical protein